MTRVPNYHSAEWNDLVAPGRHLVKSESATQFLLGDAVLAVLPMRSDGRKPPAEAYGILEGFAEALGLQREQLENYRRVSAAWPKEKRAKGVCWTAHAILSHHPDRFKMIKVPPTDPRTGEQRQQ
ncbi:DUF6192 family protein [Streptomyces sp. NBC_00400]|uniref:DUF6192 family protein n=1 Tax=Streptomyces sp. NBC_00400 TaxID=2975737 RepID=UPI002E21F988